MSDVVAHLEDKSAWSPGLLVTLCGLTAERSGCAAVWFPGWGTPKCEDCVRISERGF
ncbi:MAG TPA: hypothetical protein VG674_13000 [Amycolatopsis sp.]|nr:hypothetical protein [Amycolatopsis sp.]